MGDFTDSHSLDGPGPDEPEIPDPEECEMVDHKPKDLVDHITWCLTIAARLKGCGYDSRELSLAITHLEDARFRAGSIPVPEALTEEAG